MAQRDQAQRDLTFALFALESGLADVDTLVRAVNVCLETGRGGQTLADQLRRGPAGSGEVDRVEAMADDLLRTLADGPGTAEVTDALELAPDPDTDDGGGPTVAATVAPPGGVGDDPPSTIVDGETVAAGSDGGPVDHTVFPEPAEEFRFRVVRPHARGGLGVVSLAVDTELNREVALKQIQERHADNPASRSRFLMEAEVTGGLEHPGVVPVYGLGADADGRLYYAMRFIKGESLRDAIARFHRDDRLLDDPSARGLELRKLLRRFQVVCETIDYAHGRGVLHRDIKPANVMVGKYGETLVVDWGVAKAVGRSEPDPSRDDQALVLHSAGGATETLPGSALGTPAFMSPEQASGELDRMGPASDVYSLGATLYNLLTGLPPFEDGDVRSVLKAVREGIFSPPRRLERSVDPALEAVCLKAMALRPGDRYASARALAEDVERWMADEPVSARRDPFPERARRWMRRRKTAVSAAAAGVLMAVAGLTAVLAVQSKSNAELSAKNAELERANGRERARFALAMKAIGAFHRGVSEDVLLREKAFTTLRNKLLGGALDFYRELEGDLKGQADPASRQALGAAVYELGELSARIGRKDEALAAHRQALAIRRSLVEGTAGEGRALADVGRSLVAIARVERETRPVNEVEAVFRQAIDLLGYPARRDPGDLDVSGALADAYNGLGRLLSRTARKAEARDAYALAKRLRVAALDAPAADTPSGRERRLSARRELGQTENWLGQVLNAMGDAPGSFEAFRRGREIRRGLAEDYPDRPEFQAELAASENTIANLLGRTAGGTAEAAASFERALQARTKLVDDFPAVLRFQEDLQRTCHDDALFLFGNGQTAKALGLYDRAVAMIEALAAADREVGLYQSELAATVSDRAEVLYATGRTDEAIAGYERSRAIEAALAGRFPEVEAYRRNLALSHLALGRMLAETLRTREALDALTSARGRFRALAADNPGAPDFRHNAARADLMLGILLSDHGRPADALGPLQSARDALKALADKDATVTTYRLDLASALEALGTLLSRQGKADDALGAFRDALTIEEGLVRDDPEGTAPRAALASTLDKTAVLLAERGPIEPALAGHGKAFPLWEMLVKEEPDVPDYARGLAESHAALGEVLDRDRRDGPALDAFNKALRDFEGVAASNPGLPLLQVGLASVEKRLGVFAETRRSVGEASTHFRRAAETLEALTRLGPGERFLLASVHARLAGLAEGGEASASADAAFDAAFRAAADGFREPDRLRLGPDFAAVRKHAKCPLLLMDLAVPVDPFVQGKTESSSREAR